MFQSLDFDLLQSLDNFSSSECVGQEKVISSTSHGCPGGLEASSAPVCQRFKAANIFTLETDFYNAGDDSNYWLAEEGKVGEDQGFVIDLGCTKMVSGVNLKNTHNA